MNSHPANQILLEVCVGSLADAQAAALGGADRVELCGALELGGLTPSLGLVEQVVSEVELPVLAMIRPRAAGFCYSDGEFRSMLRDAELALAAGVAGIVFGVLEEDSTIDRERTRQLVDLAGPNDAVFHRAFDFVPDPLSSLDALMEIGVTRVLTTGGAPTALEGAETLAALTRRAAGRIEIMPGGNVTAANIAQLRAATGCKQIHSGSATSAVDPSLGAESAAGLCDLPRLAGGELRIVDQRRVEELVAACG